jgi:AraC-like DNA-binding protein
MEELAKDTPMVNADMVRSYVKIMTICAQYLTLSNAIPSTKHTVAEMAKKFIYDNYKSKITIADICDEIGCSKSTLITSFKREYGTTVNNYITDVRLGEAINMLKMGDRNIGEIATETGFSDQSYFSKVFSAKYGIPPSEYAMKK